MPEIASIAIVEPSTTTRETLRNVAQALDWVVVELEVQKYEQALVAFQDTQVDGVIIGLDDDTEKSLELVAELTQAHPQIILAVISGRPDVLVQAHRNGARYLLEAPLQMEHLIGALRGLGTGGDARRPPKAQIVAVLSSRGGVGSTTLAVNVASTLVKRPNNQVILVDLDLVLGAADIALGIELQSSLIDMALNIDQLALHVLKGALAQHESGLLVLTRPQRYNELGQLHEEHIQRLLRLIQLLATHVVVDLSKGWLATDLQTIHMADVILLVLQPDLASVRSAVLMLEALREENLDNKVFLVMNRAGAYFGKDSLTIKKAEEVLGRLVYWQVPNDYKPMMEAWNAGVPLIQASPNCKAQQSISAMVDDLCQRMARTDGVRDGAKKRHTTTKIMKLPPDLTG